MRHRKTVYTVLTCFGLFFTFGTVLKFKLMTKRSNNKKCRYPTFLSNSQGCFEHPDVWHPCRCFESVLRLKSKWDFFFFSNLAVNISSIEWSGKEVDMIQFMLTSKDCVGSSVFSLSLPSGFDSTGLILCDPVDCSPPSSSVPGVSQARIQEWFAISFFRGISLTEGSNPRLLRWQVNSLPLPHLVVERTYIYYWTHVWLLVAKPLAFWHVGRKVCLFWMVATEGMWSPLQRLTPFNLTIGGKSFYREREGGPCRNGIVKPDRHLEIRHWWSD